MSATGTVLLTWHAIESVIMCSAVRNQDNLLECRRSDSNYGVASLDNIRFPKSHGGCATPQKEWTTSDAIKPPVRSINRLFVQTTGLNHQVVLGPDDGATYGHE